MISYRRGKVLKLRDGRGGDIPADKIDVTTKSLELYT